MTQKLTISEFIKKAKLTHGEKYNYDRVVYVNYDTKVEIYCNACGCYFWQTPDNHFYSGCRICGIKTRNLKLTKSQNSFILEAKNIHGNKYNYNKVKYKTTHGLVNISCTYCKLDFWQSPAAHLSGKGCKICSYNKIGATKAKLATQFIKEAQIIHQDKLGTPQYNYHKSVYINNNSKLIINCKIHGDFLQTPNSHLRGSGCKSCYLSRKKNENEKSSKKFEIEFIKKSIEIHGSKYNYDKVNYINKNTPVEIYCNTCQIYFIQTPHCHKRAGCSICGKLSSIKKITKSQDVFINQAKLIHNNLYDYSKVNYKNSNNLITIICPEHGEFLQTPSSHLVGHGCSKCLNKNESITGKYLLEILPNVLIKHQLYWKKIFNIDTKRNIDFYFEKDGQKYIVEYNGRQHYEPVQFGKLTLQEAEINLNKQQLRDQELRDLCIQHNIKLIEIDGRIYKGTKIKDYLLQVLNLI